MAKPPRKIAFVIAASDHGTMIVNRFDRLVMDNLPGVGVGFQVLEHAAYDPDEVSLVLSLLNLRRQYYGDGVVAVDCGANIGVHTVEWAKHMTGWGEVLAFEAQERIYYALAGNLAINNCFNARAVHAAVTAASGMMKIPTPNYFIPGSFGSLELRKGHNPEFIGQPIDYAENALVEVRAVNLDSLNFGRLDLIKMDVEGMEIEALAGGANSIATYHPILLVEMIKTDRHRLHAWLEGLGYSIVVTAMNFLAVHRTDPCLAQINVTSATAR